MTDLSLTYKNCLAQWRNGILERNWESANGRSQIAQKVLPRSKVEDVLADLYGGPSGGHLGVNKNLEKASATVLLAPGKKGY
jgi:hypothetical protein